ncbi:MAG TPA: shikimate dehydrogenase [Pirellulaceae bacterium]|nr:shikimate dehydrogenase [Pirellulaceae bacterium]
MIVVTIGRGRHKMMIAEYCHLDETGAELVELRLDYIVRTVNLKRLLAEKKCPVIVTCRRAQDGGNWEGSEQERIVLLRSAIAEGADYVDLEEDIAADIPRFGKTKRIVSYHNFDETPENLREIHDRCCESDPDIVKIVTMANSPRDNLRALQMIGESEIPTVAFCMGEMGIPSRILAGKFGAPFTYTSLHRERAMAPGQFSYTEMKDLYRYDEVDVDTDVYGVIADPIGHSLSPVIHNAAFKALGLNAVYIPFRVPREELTDFMGMCRQLSIKGLSVTIPHKEEIVPLVTETDNAVDHIGAANTIVIDGFEKRAFNTDHSAALESINADISRGHDIDHLTGRTALILGAGGAAKAVTHALQTRGTKVVIAARKKNRADELAKHFHCEAVEWPARHKVRCDLLANCTPVGMHPHVDESPYHGDHLVRSMLVFDTVYNPEQTLLIKQAREKDCHVVTGVDMFVRQASIQFQLFTGEEPPTDIMRQAIRQSIGATKA